MNIQGYKVTRVVHLKRLISLLLVGVSLATGCGTGEHSRKAVTGTVVFDGQPLQSGIVSFMPLGGGQSAAARIVEGHFQAGSDRGLLPGKYKVLIESYEEDPIRNPADDDDGPDMGRQIIPDKYNRNTELSIEVTNAGLDELKFDLTSH